MTTLDWTRIDSPVGPLLLVASGDTLLGCEFDSKADRIHALRARLDRALGAHELREAPDPAGAVTRLARYFAGDVHALDAPRVRMLGTPFQEIVWRALLEIPVGETRSYGQIAQALGVPDASRAVGAANGANPIALFVPCHRVIAADGTLHGYGGGLDRKAWLLKHEGARWAGSESLPQLGLT